MLLGEIDGNFHSLSATARGQSVGLPSLVENIEGIWLIQMVRCRFEQWQDHNFKYPSQSHCES